MWPNPDDPYEPYWLPEDIDSELEYLEYLDSLCSGCGQPRGESFDPANQFEYHTEALVCHSCADRESTAEARRKSENAVTYGEYYLVSKREGR